MKLLLENAYQTEAGADRASSLSVNHVSLDALTLKLTTELSYFLVRYVQTIPVLVG
jgi:hypothetical protein